jgi:hypothetical protein
MPSSRAKEFFLHIAVIALLYTGTVAILNLLFRVINVAFPQIDRYSNYYYGGSPISLPVATLIVTFPLFLYLSNVLRKSYEEDSSKKEFAVRKWLVYVTLFVAGSVLAGDLVTLIYFFLDGRELTTGFLLKVLAVLVVAGGIFGYYMDDLKNRLTGNRRNIWRIGATVLVLGSIIAGFAALGSPATQRALRTDSQRVSDLESIQWQVINYWQQKGEVPESLEQARDPLSSWDMPTDPETEMPYEYVKTGNLSFNLCATFGRPSPKAVDNQNFSRPMMDASIGIKGSSNWQHEAGYKCFERTIDPEFYPVRPKI